MIKKNNNIVPWIYITLDLIGEEIIGTFCEKSLQKTNQKEFRIAKISKKKMMSLFVKGEGYDNQFNSLTDKKTSLYAMSYFPEPYTRS